MGSISKIGFFDHLNFGKYEPGHLYVGPFSAKIFLKIRVCKIDPSVKEGCGKGSLFAFLEAARAVVGSICRIGQVLARQRVMFVRSKEGRGAFVAHTAPQTLASLSTAHSSSPEFHLCLNMLSASSVRWVDEREEAQLASCTKAAQACGRSTQFAREQAATREWLQEEKERAGAILTATRQLRTPRLMMMLSITTLTSVKALGTKRIQSCPYPFLPHKSPPPCDLPVTVETFPSQPQTRSVYREPLQ